MKTKKQNGLIAVAVVAVALITTVAFVMGCRPEAGLPDGYETIQVNFGNNIARTVLPDDEYETITDFAVVGLHFSSPSGDLVAWFPAAAVSPAITVMSGTYTIVATAYKEGTLTVPASGYIETGGPTLLPGDVAGPLAWGSTSVTTSGATNTASIILRASAYVNTTERPGMSATGTFSYKITNITTATTVGTIDVTGYSSNGGSGVTGLVTGGILASQEYVATPPRVWQQSSLAAGVGFYTLAFTFTRAGTTVNHEYIMHIYSGMNTHFEFELTDDYFAITSVTITVNLVYERPTDEDLAPKVTPGGTGTPNAAGLAMPSRQISKTAPQTVSFALTNSGDFDPAPTITINGVSAAFDTLYTAGLAPFAANGAYQVIITGIRPTTSPYPGTFTTVFWVKVVD